MRLTFYRPFENGDGINFWIVVVSLKMKWNRNITIVFAKSLERSNFEARMFGNVMINLAILIYFCAKAYKIQYIKFKKVEYLVEQR